MIAVDAHHFIHITDGKYTSGEHQVGKEYCEGYLVISHCLLVIWLLFLYRSFQRHQQQWWPDSARWGMEFGAKVD